jgi:hypothetical protein
MAAYNKFNRFVLDVLEGRHNFLSHTFRVALSNTAPVNTNTVLSNITQIPDGNGYVAGGNIATMSATITGGTARVTAANTAFTASGGPVGPLRYAVLYNATASGAPLIAWWDYGSSITLANTEQFNVVFDAVGGVFTLT